MHTNLSLLLLLGPSFAGKTTLIERLATEFPELIEIIPSYTTRSPRGDDTDRHYIFVNVQWFEDHKEQMPNWVQAPDGILYGNLKSQIDNPLKAGKIPVLAVYEDGVENFRRAGYGTFCAIVDPVNRHAEHKRPGRDQVDRYRIRLREDWVNATIINDFDDPDGFEKAYASLKTAIASLLTRS